MHSLMSELWIVDEVWSNFIFHNIFKFSFNTIDLNVQTLKYKELASPSRQDA